MLIPFRLDRVFLFLCNGKMAASDTRIGASLSRNRAVYEYLERIGPFFVGRVVWQSAEQRNEAIAGDKSERSTPSGRSPVPRRPQ
jgi:hypothetical protein